MNSNEQTKIRCIIVDDEQASQRVLKHFIKENPALELLASCINTEQAFTALEEHKNVDLLFLDINMPQESGLDFYKRLAHPPQVIFTTAYPEYAVQGFDLNATDYLLKPIAYDRFLQAVEKALNKVSKPEKDFIMLNENKVLHKVLFKDIVYAEAAGDYVKVYSSQKMIMTHSTFTDLISKLPKNFIRTHKSFVANANQIEQLEGNQLILGGEAIPIGQTYKAAVKEALGLD